MFYGRSEILARFADLWRKKIPSLVVEPGATLEAIVPGLPQGVTYVDVLHTTGTISLAPQAGDSAHKRFFAGPSQGGMALRYGNPLGMTIIGTVAVASGVSLGS